MTDVILIPTSDVGRIHLRCMAINCTDRNNYTFVYCSNSGFIGDNGFLISAKILSAYKNNYSLLPNEKPWIALLNWIEMAHGYKAIRNCKGEEHLVWLILGVN